MLTSGFTNTPVTKLLVAYTVISAFVASVVDVQYLLYVKVVPHLWEYGQWWRILTWQACFANSTEVLFAAMTFYQLRVIERMWGSRKFASFIVSTLPYTTLLPPLLLALVLRPLTFNHANYLPAGPTPLLFALLAQYHATVPHTYKYRLATSAPRSTHSNTSSNTTNNVSSDGGSGGSGGNGGSAGTGTTALLLTSKTLSYLLPAQLALSALPGSALSAAIGWAVGYAWRNDMLPLGSSAWRVPGWVVGDSGAETRRGGGGSSSGSGSGAGSRTGDRQEFEGLRRRMEREAAAGSSSAVTGREGGGAEGVGGEGAAGAEARRRGTLGGLLAGQFGGVRS